MFLCVLRNILTIRADHYLQPLYLTIGPVSDVFSVHPNTADEVIAI